MDVGESITLLKALADESRLMILNALMDGPRSVEELATRMDLAASTISFHLKKMEGAGLVCKTRNQYYAMYSLNEDVFDRPLKGLITFQNIQKFVQEQRMEKFRQKVLKAFFRNRRLVRLPAQHKKRLIVLEEFARLFHPGRVYAEQEVDSLIEPLCDDYCTIRRQLIEEHYLERERHEYRTARPLEAAVR